VLNRIKWRRFWEKIIEEEMGEMSHHGGGNHDKKAGIPGV